MAADLRSTEADLCVAVSGPCNHGFRTEIPLILKEAKKRSSCQSLHRRALANVLESGPKLIVELRNGPHPRSKIQHGCRLPNIQSWVLEQHGLFFLGIVLCRQP
jgi:hypothetical protein